MAKKNRLASLVDAITDKPKETDQGQDAAPRQGNVPSSIVEELGISPEMEDKLNIIRQEKVGRPKGRKNGNPKERENRATFIVSPEIVRKLKYISLMESRLYKVVVSEALQSYIDQWEDRNGKINLPNNTRQ